MDSGPRPRDSNLDWVHRPRRQTRPGGGGALEGNRTLITRLEGAHIDLYATRADWGSDGESNPGLRVTRPPFSQLNHLSVSTGRTDSHGCGLPRSSHCQLNVFPPELMLSFGYRLELMGRLELPFSLYQSDVLPLNYTSLTWSHRAESNPHTTRTKRQSFRWTTMACGTC